MNALIGPAGTDRAVRTPQRTRRSDAPDTDALQVGLLASTSRARWVPHCSFWKQISARVLTVTVSVISRFLQLENKSGELGAPRRITTVVASYKYIPCALQVQVTSTREVICNRMNHYVIKLRPQGLHSRYYGGCVSPWGYQLWQE